MNLIAGTGVVLGVLAVFFGARAMRSIRRRRVLRAFGAGAGALTATFGAAIALLLAYSYLSYVRLTGEQLVSTIEFRRVAPDEYRARLMLPDERDQFFNLRGDEWQIDAKLITWKPPATVLGLDPIFKLERLSGRYADIDRERNEERTVHALSPGGGVDLWALARRFPLLMPGIDAYYGSATYVPMLDGARFDVSLSRDTLLARPANEIARNALGEWDGQRQ